MQNFVGKTKCIVGYMKVADEWMNVWLLCSLAKSRQEWGTQYIEATKPLVQAPPVSYTIT